MDNQDRYKNMWRFCCSFVNWGLNIGMWTITWILYYSDTTSRPWHWKGNLLITMVYGLILMMVTVFYGGYRIGYYRLGDVILSNTLACLITGGITYLQVFLIAAGVISPIPILALVAVQMIITTVWAVTANKLYLKKFPPHKMLLVYGGSAAAKSLIEKMLSRSEKYQIHEAIGLDDGFDKAISKIDGYRAVVLCDVPAKLRNHLLKYCFSKSIRTYVTPKISDILIRGADSIHLFDTPLLLSRNQGFTMEQRAVKRAMDLAVSGLGLVIASPFMLIIAAAIKLGDRGPALYSQDRLTLNGRVFRLYKFRSMVVDAEKREGAVLAAEGDSRITKVGAVLRKFRLDELPQLINIFRGDMSLVGPRPERPELAAEYSRAMEEFSYRLKVKAGLTGYAQVQGKYNTTPYDKLKLDLMYIAGYSLLLDMKLILMTVKILFQKESTEGLK